MRTRFSENKKHIFSGAELAARISQKTRPWLPIWGIFKCQGWSPWDFQQSSISNMYRPLNLPCVPTIQFGHLQLSSPTFHETRPCVVILECLPQGPFSSCYWWSCIIYGPKGGRSTSRWDGLHSPKALWLALVFNFDLLTQGSQGHDPSLENPNCFVFLMIWVDPTLLERLYRWECLKTETARMRSTCTFAFRHPEEEYLPKITSARGNMGMSKNWRRQQSLVLNHIKRPSMRGFSVVALVEKHIYWI